MKLRDDRAVVGGRLDEVAGEHHEAGGVVVLVLDVGDEHVEPVDLGGQRRGDGGLRRVAGLLDLAGGAGGVAGDHRAQAVLADDLAALAEGVHVAVHGADLVEASRPAAPAARTGCAGSARPRCAGVLAGRKWWMSATRPASELSIGIIARSASPPSTAAKTSSKLAQAPPPSPGSAAGTPGGSWSRARPGRRCGGQGRAQRWTPPQFRTGPVAAARFPGAGGYGRCVSASESHPRRLAWCWSRCAAGCWRAAAARRRARPRRGAGGRPGPAAGGRRPPGRGRGRAAAPVGGEVRRVRRHGRPPQLVPGPRSTTAATAWS